MSLDCESINSEMTNRSNDEQMSIQMNGQAKIQSNENESIKSRLTKTARVPSAPAKKRIKIDQQQQLIDESRPSSFSSTSLTPSPSPKADQSTNGLNDNQFLLKESSKDNPTKDAQHREQFNKSNQFKLNRPETPPSADLNNPDLVSMVPTLLTPNHPALNGLSNISNLSQLNNPNPLVNPNLITTLQNQFFPSGNVAAHLSPNSMKSLKFSIDNILQQKQQSDQLKNNKFLQDSANGLSKYIQLHQHHIQMQKQHMQYKQQQSNQSKSPLNENNESNDSTNFKTSSNLNISSMAEESKNNLATIWSGWPYHCGSYDPASGK